MSNPWLPATVRLPIPINACRTSRSRPLTTQTGQRSASAETTLRMRADSTASWGRSTMGVRVPS